jgi:hypothetical protein
MRKSKISTNESWNNIFEKYEILKGIEAEGYFDITADQIKAVDGKEPRLMTKVDFRENLPTIMRDHTLSILAVKNGLYRIAKNDPFIDIDENISTKITEIEVPKNLVSIDPFNIKSESAALDIAYISKMCDQVFGEDTHLSIRGRLRGELDFEIDSIAYNIDGVQIEVDGGYEGQKSIHLVEAKIGFRNNINIRQLLYPQLYWQKELDGVKDLKSYVFYLHNDVFRFIPYIYDGKVGYADHSNEIAFRFVQPESKFNIYDVAVDESLVDQSVPFPQADKFEKVQDMLLVISQNGCINKQELNLEFDLVSRQIDYYLNVLKWLKVCKEDDECITLSDLGERIVKLPFKNRIEELSKIVFSEPIANNFLHKKEINDDMYAKYGMKSDSTRRRRLQTLSAWINYFENILIK